MKGQIVPPSRIITRWQALTRAMCTKGAASMLLSLPACQTLGIRAGLRDNVARRNWQQGT